MNNDVYCERWSAIFVVHRTPPAPGQTRSMKWAFCLDLSARLLENRITTQSPFQDLLSIFSLGCASGRRLCFALNNKWIPLNLLTFYRRETHSYNRISEFCDYNLSFASPVDVGQTHSDTLSEDVGSGGGQHFRIHLEQFSISRPIVFGLFFRIVGQSMFRDDLQGMKVYVTMLARAFKDPSSLSSDIYWADPSCIILIQLHEWEYRDALLWHNNPSHPKRLV